MPDIRDGSPADRALGQRTNVHPRRNGDMILEPDDILEGIGNFLSYDADGQPVGWDLGQVESPDGRHVYIGPTPDTCVRQTTSPLPYSRPSHLVNYEIDPSGPIPPNATYPRLAKIPRPEAATVTQQSATGAGALPGYPASTGVSPHWVAIAWVKNGRLTAYGPPAKFALSHGQCARVFLPARSSMPEGIHHVAVLMAEPGTSKPTRPGVMRVQRILDLRYFHEDFYELTGPYRYDGEAADGRNDTKLPVPPAPTLKRAYGNQGARVGNYRAQIVWCDSQGNSMPGIDTPVVSIHTSGRYTILTEEGTLVYKPGAGYVPADPKHVAFRAGEGKLEITRPAAPLGATGWKILLYIQATEADTNFTTGWRWVVSRYSQRGNTLPIQLDTRTVSTSGWDGTEEYYAANDPWICIDADLPTENTSGVPAPEDELQPPEPFGAARPEPQTLYVRVTDVVRGAESLPSKAAKLQLDEYKLPVVVFANPENRIPNSTIIETGPTGNPLHWTIDKAGAAGYTEVSDQTLVLGTPATAPTGITPSGTTAHIPIDPTKPLYAEGYYATEEPLSGAPIGQSEAVLIQTSDTGGATETILHSATNTLPGEHEFAVTISAAGGAAPALLPNSVSVAIRWRFNPSAQKNGRLRIKHTEVRDRRHKRRRRRRHSKPPKKNPIRNPPVLIQDPPEPPWSPETLPVALPDRPISRGATIEALALASGLPAGYAATQTGGGQLTFDPTTGLNAKKTLGGSLSEAHAAKTYAPPSAGFAYRHSLGLLTDASFPVLPSGGILEFNALRGTNNRRLAHLEVSTAVEKVSLKIDDDPTGASPASLTLDTTSYELPVNATTEVQDLTISLAPTQAGSMTIVTDGHSQPVTPGGTPQTFRLDVPSSCTLTKTVYITVNGISHGVNLTKGMSRNQVAKKIADHTYKNFDADLAPTGTSVEFRAHLAGAMPNPTANPNSSGTAIAVSNIVQGTSETREALAERIALLAWNGWSTTISPAGPHVIRFTATSPGPRAPSAVTPNNTGATVAFTTIQDGSIDTKTQFATAIAAMAFTGWTQTRSQSTIIFTATTAGVKQNATYRPQGSGATATIQTLVQGSNGDITAVVPPDASGTPSRTRKIISAIPANRRFRTDISISGAHTDRAVVSLWGSLSLTDGTPQPLQHLARFEDVDLSDTGVAAPMIGVVGESAASLTWHYAALNAEITQAGKTHARDHDPHGSWMPQLECYTDSTQPTRQDLLLQNGRMAVIPGEHYTIGLFARAHIPSQTGAKLLTITALMAADSEADGGRRVLGDVTDETTTGAGITGPLPWTELKKTVQVPEGCYELSLDSRDIGPAEITIQEVAASRGHTLKRTGLYQTTGEYIPTYDLRTTKRNTSLTPGWTFKRINLGAITHTPDAQTAVISQFRSTTPDPADPLLPDANAYSAFVSDQALVPDYPFVQSRFVLTGPGTSTPELKSGSPYCEYLLVLGSKRVSTLLREDRSEFPGGAVFSRLAQWSPRTTDARRRLPSGRLNDEPRLFEPFGHLPEVEILVFDADTKAEIEHHWKRPFVAEVYGKEAITIKLSAQPEFVPETKRFAVLESGTHQSIWKATLAPSEVTASIRLPHPQAA